MNWIIPQVGDAPTPRDFEVQPASTAWRAAKALDVSQPALSSWLLPTRSALILERARHMKHRRADLGDVPSRTFNFRAVDAGALSLLRRSMAPRVRARIVTARRPAARAVDMSVVRNATRRAAFDGGSRLRWNADGRGTGTRTSMSARSSCAGRGGEHRAASRCSSVPLAQLHHRCGVAIAAAPIATVLATWRSSACSDSGCRRSTSINIGTPAFIASPAASGSAWRLPLLIRTTFLRTSRVERVRAVMPPTRARAS